MAGVRVEKFVKRVLDGATKAGSQLGPEVVERAIHNLSGNEQKRLAARLGVPLSDVMATAYLNVRRTA